ncbi:histidine phosphatase family protein [Nocardia cyriacigeorgica]|uniref:histidine phosphatase family protein n=1 Tax=Nocardia cyriacigeorgica TaxID=135487 RepID=UPI0018937581|nr:histidine phosphatase family protein [Nocardia cyriacigeorgica]MBF6454304.1 histidine phosphatase family protein [Nocardia cyriacigeorgica]MBF6479776.1 histidine phosphatase family protein [Nocardia cyriacigeorgica]MBF6552198.1 histidine phosphatase family protein [Nocardia cyriacigeorgica]
MRPTLLLVRHADAGIPRADGPDDHRRALTAAGRRSARRLVCELLACGPTVVASSPYLRAAQTVAPTAQAAGRAVRTDSALREWDSGIAPTPDYARWYARSWARPETARPGGESLRQLSERAVSALSRWAEAAGGPIVVGSRGMFIAAALAGYGIAGIGWPFVRALPMPAIYRLEFDPSGAVVVAGPGL